MGEGSHGCCRINAFGLKRRPHRLFGDSSVDALGLKVTHEPSRTPAAAALGRGEIDREPRIIEQALAGQPVQCAIDGRRRVLFLQQPAPQVEARVRAPRDRSKRGTVRGLDVCQLLQLSEGRLGDVCANLQSQICKICGPQGRKTPPIQFDDPVVGPAQIGGECGENHSSLADVSSSAGTPDAFTPRCSFTFASTSADMSGWSFR